MVEPNKLNSQKPSTHGNFHLRHYRSVTGRTDSSLRRRAAAPIMLDVRSAAAAAATSDLDLHRLWRAGPGVITDHTGYTSIRELLASFPPVCGIASPTGTSVSSAHDIQIRNHLVKHAAYAYLQPTPSATETRRRRGLFRRTLAAASFGACARFFGRMLQTICSGRKPSS